ncbi:MAG: hypothetical protein V1777_03940 [Candidatus Micrarchaeota archaeon]
MNWIFSKRSTSDWVVFLVSKKQGLRCREIWDEMQVQGVTVSYQNVHKTLLSMVKNNVLENRNNRYFVSTKWVAELRRFADSVQT